MHTQMLVYLMFFFFEISAGMTEFPCKHPCSWRNKTFAVYDDDGSYLLDWSFSSDGQTSVAGTLQQQCNQITERFLIDKQTRTGIFQCYSIFYDIASPLKFQFEQGGGFLLFNHTGELTDICRVCNGGNVFEAVALGAEPTPPPINSLACNIPSTCTSTLGTVCNKSDIIPQDDCPVATTESPTTTTEQTTTITEATTTKEPTKTSKSHCGKKIHKHTK